MATFGTNLKLTIARAHQPRVRDLFVEVLGATARQPMPGLEAYILADGGSVGVFYVEASEALDEEHQSKGSWLEFRVEDAAGIAAKLAESGVKRIAYQDTTHAYFQIPGGPVFRLAEGAPTA
jgi:hypothetical protein